MSARKDSYQKCGFYDPMVSHGGPNPNIEYKPTVNDYWGESKSKLDFERSRRSAYDCNNWEGETRLF